MQELTHRKTLKFMSGDITYVVTWQCQLAAQVMNQVMTVALTVSFKTDKV